jgi:dihydroorotase
MTATVFRGGRVLDPASGRDEIADVHVHDGRIASRSTAARVIDCTGKWVVPGLIDMHVHLREPGFEYKEDVASGALAAVRGGFATILAMPNTKPVIDHPSVVALVQAKARAAGLARVLIAGAITVGQKGVELTPMLGLAEAGCVAFTDDGRPVPTAALMRRALEYAQSAGLPVIAHAEDLSLSHGGHMHEGEVSCGLGLGGIPAAAEEICIARDLMLAALTGGRLHIAHLSTRGGIEMVREAKQRGLRVSCEVSPHHFSLTHARVGDYDTHAKMNPPLRTQADIEALIEGMRDGTVDAIATDHAPHAALDKDVPFAEAPFGIVGLETAVPLTLALGLEPLRAIALLTTGPARVLGLALGTLKEGAAADVTVIDPTLRWQVERLHSRSQNSPWLGESLQGKAVCTMVEGVLHEF